MNHNSIYGWTKLTKYWLKVMVKKIHLICFILFYWLMLFVMIIAIPLIQTFHFDVIFVVKSPIAASVLALGCALTIIVIVVEIFRTSIDEGIEILLCSKQVSRNDIFFSKIITYLIFLFVLCSVSVAIASFSSLLNDITFFEVKSLILGVFIATITIGLLFSGITLIFCIYFNKITSILTVFSVAIFFCLFSVLLILKGSNPLMMNKSSQNQLKHSEIIVDSKQKQFEMVGGTIVENSNGLLPNEIYNQYYKKSSLNYLNQINIFGQLSNMYSFNTGYYNPLLYFSRSKKYVENNKLVFNNLENITSFNLSIDWLTNNIGEPNYLSPKTTQINYYRFMDNSLLSEYSVNQKNKPDVIDIEKFNHKDVDNSLFNQYWEKYKDEIQIEYNNYFDLIKDQNSGLTIDDIPNPFSLLLNKISIEKELDKNKYNEFDLFIEDLILSAYYELNYLFANKNIDIFNVIDFFNLENKLNILDDNDINKVKLKDVFTDYNNWSLTSKNKFSEIVNDGNIPIIINADTKFYDIQKKMQSPNNKYGIEIKNNLANNQLKYLALLKTVGLEVNKKIDFYNYLSNDNNDDFFNRFFIKKINDNFVYDNQNNLRTNNNQVYDYWTYLCLNDSSFFIDNNFQEVKVVSIYNSNALFITYNIVSIIIIAIGLILYNKKDFY